MKTPKQKIKLRVKLVANDGWKKTIYTLYPRTNGLGKKDYGLKGWVAQRYIHDWEWAYTLDDYNTSLDRKHAYQRPLNLKVGQEVLYPRINRDDEEGFMIVKRLK